MDLSEYVGRTFDDGTFTVEPWAVHLWADATKGEEGTYNQSSGDEIDYASPMLGQLIAREAASTTDLEADLREGELADADVFLGGHRFSFEEPIRVGVTYRARAEITDVTNEGGESGGLSVMTVAYTVEMEDGAPAYEMETDLVIREGGA